MKFNIIAVKPDGTPVSLQAEAPSEVSLRAAVEAKGYRILEVTSGETSTKVAQDVSPGITSPAVVDPPVVSNSSPPPLVARRTASLPNPDPVPTAAAEARQAAMANLYGWAVVGAVVLALALFFWLFVGRTSPPEVQVAAADTEPAPQSPQPSAADTQSAPKAAQPSAPVRVSQPPRLSVASSPKSPSTLGDKESKTAFTSRKDPKPLGTSASTSVQQTSKDPADVDEVIGHEVVRRNFLHKRFRGEWKMIGVSTDQGNSIKPVNPTQWVLASAYVIRVNMIAGKEQDLQIDETFTCANENGQIVSEVSFKNSPLRYSIEERDNGRLLVVVGKFVNGEYSETIRTLVDLIPTPAPQKSPDDTRSEAIMPKRDSTSREPAISAVAPRNQVDVDDNWGTQPFLADYLPKRFRGKWRAIEISTDQGRTIKKVDPPADYMLATTYSVQDLIDPKTLVTEETMISARKDGSGLLATYIIFKKSPIQILVEELPNSHIKVEMGQSVDGKYTESFRMTAVVIPTGK